MALFDFLENTRIGSTLQSAGKDGLKKANELKDTANLTIDIKKREAEISKMFLELGKAYYHDHKNDTDPEYSQVLAIAAAFEEIDDLKASKDSIKGVKRCPVCGSAITTSARFCPECGASLGNEPEDDVDDIIDVPEEEQVEVDDTEEVIKEAVESVEEAAKEVEETKASIDEMLNELNKED